MTAQTTGELGVTYRRAFAVYSREHRAMRAMTEQLPSNADSACIHGINAQHGTLRLAERDYAGARREYVNRVLATSSKFSKNRCT